MKFNDEWHFLWNVFVFLNSFNLKPLTPKKTIWNEFIFAENKRAELADYFRAILTSLWFVHGLGSATSYRHLVNSCPWNSWAWCKIVSIDWDEIPINIFNSRVSIGKYVVVSFLKYKIFCQSLFFQTYWKGNCCAISGVEM